MNLTTSQIEKAAKKIGCDPAAIMAVIYVETPSPHVGDTPSGKPLILNERHWFYKLSKGPWSRKYPELSNKKAGGYCTGRNWIIRQECEYKRLEKKLSLEREPALKSVSMGLFQVMGFNHNIIGYNDVEDMWKDALKQDDTIDLDWFIEFVIANKLDDELARLDFKGFARGYNGPAYARNKYDIKLLNFYNKFKPIFKKHYYVSDLFKLEPRGIELHDTISGFPDFSQTIGLA